MEIGKQIKKYRQDLKLSQDELAEKIYVSRQTISNWENEKNYPDVKSLLLLSSLFGISLDILVKGDLEDMKKEINTEELRAFGREGTIFTILFFACIILPVPLGYFLGWWGLAAYLVLWVVAFYFGVRLERIKKANDIQTYKEVLAFTEGRGLDELEKIEEKAKRPYQNILKCVIAALITLIVCLLMGILFCR
ncbi:MAG: helix-turn-helix domain-containing protein [Lachnospiraceae bacterium]